VPSALLITSSATINQVSATNKWPLFEKEATSAQLNKQERESLDKRHKKKYAETTIRELFTC